MHWYLEVLKKYAVFEGRAGRKEFWYFNIINGLISIVLAIIDIGTGSFGIVLLVSMYSLAVLIPSIAVSVRRLHDTDRSGGWFFIAFVPLIGVFILSVFLVQESQPGDNQYGKDPSG